MPTFYSQQIAYNDQTIHLSSEGEGYDIRSSDYGYHTAMQGILVIAKDYVEDQNGNTNYTSLTGTLLFPFDSIPTNIGQLTSVTMTIGAAGGHKNQTRDIQCYVNSVTPENKLNLLTTSGYTGGNPVNITWTNPTDLRKILNAITNNSLTLKINNGETVRSYTSDGYSYSHEYVRIYSAKLTFVYDTISDTPVVRYYKDGAWHPCKMHYYNGTTWVPVKPHYYTNGTWKECRVIT